MESLLPAQMLDVKDDAHQPPFLDPPDPTWRPPTSGGDHACAPAVDLQPTWAAQPGRKCGGGGDDHSTAAAAADPEDPKRALVHALQNDLSRMLVQLERLDEMLSA